MVFLMTPGPVLPRSGLSANFIYFLHRCGAGDELSLA
ncbi:MAG: hypothetical protein BJ554DRAFT_4056 [Olpidium bornovanus]|uniref:Uncharacterized protein n=1 Tax=Olpidium bornovanus TaxID=278681 RepID=A0A8H7ZNA1_9FUNG|nr:MAG: hypothetical protein BJ554DRAFT_4056 [Olpidium bornovanus]